MTNKTFLLNDCGRRLAPIKYTATFEVYDHTFVVFREVKYNRKTQRYVRKNKSFLTAHLESGVLIQRAERYRTEEEAIEKSTIYLLKKTKERVDSSVADALLRTQNLLHTLLD